MDRRGYAGYEVEDRTGAERAEEMRGEGGAVNLIMEVSVTEGGVVANLVAVLGMEVEGGSYEGEGGEHWKPQGC